MMNDDMRMRYTTLDSGHLYVILDGTPDQVRRVLAMQTDEQLKSLEFRIKIEDIYGYCYREHLLYTRPEMKKGMRNHG